MSQRAYHAGMMKGLVSAFALIALVFPWFEAFGLKPHICTEQACSIGEKGCSHGHGEVCSLEGRRASGRGEATHGHIGHAEQKETRSAGAVLVCGCHGDEPGFYAQPEGGTPFLAVHHLRGVKQPDEYGDT